MRRLEPDIEDTYCYSDRPCWLPTIPFIPWIATWGKEGWEKRAVLGSKKLHILYTQAEGSLTPNKHVNGCVSGDIIFAKVAAERRKVAPLGWEYEDVNPKWLGTVFMKPALNIIKVITSSFAHGHAKPTSGASISEMLDALYTESDRFSNKVNYLYLPNK